MIDIKPKTEDFNTDGQIWKIKTNKNLLELHHNTNRAFSLSQASNGDVTVAFEHDGLIISIKADMTMSFWDVLDEVNNQINKYRSIKS